MKALPRGLFLLALILVAVNLRPGITSLAPLIERIASELSLSRSFISLSTALPVLCMGLLAPLAPRVAVRLGLERTISLCVALICLALVARLAAQNSSVLIASAVVLGAGIAVAGPLLSGYIKRHFAGRVGKVVIWYSVAMSIGGAAGAVLTVPLMNQLGGSWHLGLAIWAVPALLALLVCAVLPNQAEQSQAEGGAGLPWREPRAWLLSCFFAIQAGLFYAVATWMVARYHEAGLSLLRSNSLFSLIMLLGLPSSFIFPWLSQRFNARYGLLIGCALVTCLCLSMITFKPLLLPEFWASLLGLSLGGSFALSLVLPLYEADSPIAVSRWTAMMLFTGYSLGSLTPILSGWARDLSGSYRLPFAVLAVLAAVMVLLVWGLGRKPRS